MDQEDYLCHHGVRGMKWGIRKRRVSSGKSRGSKKTTQIKNKSVNVKKNVKKKIENIDKEKVKKVAKTTAVVAGKAAVGILVGTYGSMLGMSILNGYADTRNRRYIEVFGDSYLRGLKNRYM